MCFRNKHGFFGWFAPLNQILILLGMILFFYTGYLGISNMVQNIQYLQYADFDVIGRLMAYRIDWLTFNKTSIFGYSSLLGTILLVVVGLRVANVSYKKKKAGIVGYIFMFFLYQIFWVGAYWAVIRGKRVTWR
jgi:hypothetical protein